MRAKIHIKLLLFIYAVLSFSLIFVGMEGSLYQVLEYKEGMGKNGHWEKQYFVVKRFGVHVSFLHCVCWGKDVKTLQSLHINDQIEFHIEISSREYNGKWYSDVTASNISLLPPEPAPFMEPKPQVTPTEPVDNKLFNDSEFIHLPF